GVGAPALFNGLAEARSAVGPIRSFDPATFPVRVAAEVDVRAIDSAWLRRHLGPLDDFPHAAAALDRFGRIGAWRDRKIGFGLLAALEAWRMAACGAAGQEAMLSLALGLEQAFLDDFA